MALGVTSETVAGGNLSWLGSRHGVANARTGTLKTSAFTDKHVPSGTPVSVDTDGLYVPYTDGALTGFVINDSNVEGGDEPVAILDHGRIRVANLPVEFTVPANAGAFIFVEEA
ncbi:hypothetical protein [Flaviflexus massiliensis]|uniref:hypothetical protein n=1 Tax=Flaviflexus massiliensis TaxID=1522309 RepID=UPI0006D58E01|nr:hypothetical protein [Flaviflexus massiliensis]